MSKFTYRVVQESDTEKVRALINGHFHTDEPLSKSLRTPPPDSLTEYTLSVIPLGFSTLAEDSEGNLAGVRLAYPRPPLSEDDGAEEKGAIGTFLNFVSVQTEPLVQQFNSKRVMQSMLLSVDSKYRGQGLGYNLYAENMKLAKSCGFTSYICDCTSAFSARLCEKLGMTKFYELKYTDYKDKQGQQIMYPEEPHTIFRSYVKHF